MFDSSHSAQHASHRVPDHWPDSLGDEAPSPFARATTLAVVALVTGIVLWSALAKVDVVAVAEGRLVPRGYTKLVQPAQGGVVSAVLVKDDEVVREGQVLLTLDGRLSEADTKAALRDLDMQRLALRRVSSELADRPVLSQHGDAPDLLVQVQAQWRARRQALHDSLALETESISRADAELRAAKQTLAKLEQTLPLARQTADAFRKLVAEGFVGELAAADRQRDAIEKERDLDAQIATVAALQSAVGQATARMANLRSQYRSQLESERMDTARAISRIEQELDKARTRATMLEVRAPHDGVIKDLTVTSRGAVVEPGDVLMSIVPVGEPLQAKVAVRNEDIGFVAAGQAVKLKIAAYSFQKHGLLDGHVAMVSADTSSPRSADTRPPTYRAIVQLASERLYSTANGAPLAFAPGMTVTAEIHQGRRTVLDYLLSPVHKTTHEAARER